MNQSQSAGAPPAQAVNQGDPRPITRPLLKKIIAYANDEAAFIAANAKARGCRHPDTDEFDNFCSCGALLSLENALNGVIPLYGVAYALQAVLSGSAISAAQKKWVAKELKTAPRRSVSRSRNSHNHVAQ